MSAEVLDALPFSAPSPRPESEFQTRRKKIHCKQELIVSSLQRFYTQRSDADQLMALLEGTSEISLRLIDWFVTNYAKQHNTAYILNGQEFLVYMNYKAQLKAYSKKLFDPFCRRERILFQIPGHPQIVTTVGKLNFFRWAIEKGVLDHIKENQEVIEKAMNASAREIQKARKAESASSTDSTATTLTAASSVTATTASSRSSTTRKRGSGSGLPIAAKMMEKHDYAVEVRFD